MNKIILIGLLGLAVLLSGCIKKEEIDWNTLQDNLTVLRHEIHIDCEFVKEHENDTTLAFLEGTERLCKEVFPELWETTTTTIEENNECTPYSNEYFYSDDCPSEKKSCYEGRCVECVDYCYMLYIENYDKHDIDIKCVNFTCVSFGIECEKVAKTDYNMSEPDCGYNKYSDECICRDKIIDVPQKVIYTKNSKRIIEEEWHWSEDIVFTIINAE